MLDDQSAAAGASAAAARMRNALGATQATVAAAAGLDQSRVSRIEKGEVSSVAEVEPVLDALSSLGSKEAAAFKDFMTRDWEHVQPPNFWNPQRASLEIADETLGKIESFLADDERPWPLRRQVERHKEMLLRGAAYLNRLSHNIAFIGDIGVGKSTALSFIFDLLVPSSLAAKPMDRPILETGAGGTTICEVHIRRGPEFGIAIQPLPDSELRSLVSDFCAAKWIAATNTDKDAREAASVSRETERAIRNMAGLVRRQVKEGGKITYFDPVVQLIESCASEDELRTRILEMMKLGDRTRSDLWYDSGSRQHPMEWIAKAFREINNGRVPDVTLPKMVDLVIPGFGKDFGELELTVIDTKGVDDVAIREDLDIRLKDSRTAVIFCSRFNDAPGITAKSLLQHLRQTFSEPINNGKIGIMTLPRPEEARAMKDDAGNTALTDEEGHSLKQIQIESDLAKDKMDGIPILFFNAQADAPEQIRGALLEQLSRMRNDAADRLFDLCAAVDDLIKHHEAEAMIAAVEEVAKRLATFLDAHAKLAARDATPQAAALSTVRSIRYASTLWACTRRNGEYSGLNVMHQVGVGAARDAARRSARWFASLEDTLAALKKDEGLALASKTIEQIGRSAANTRGTFLEAVQRAGMEVYYEPLSRASVWAKCASEWGRGPGFKERVVQHLDAWFRGEATLSDRLEEMVNALWDRTVLAPLRRLVEEAEPAPEAIAPDNVVPFVARA